MSKFLSFILRHNPGAIGLTLDEHGWVPVEELIRATKGAGVKLNRDRLRKIVAASDKQRFAFSEDGSRIRASHGHSVPVDLGLKPHIPPATLFHGTASHYLTDIYRNGLLPGERNFIHLSLDRESALLVGRRHGYPVVLEIDAGRMHKHEFAFYQSENGIWLTKRVPVEFIIFQSENR